MYAPVRHYLYILVMEVHSRDLSLIYLPDIAWIDSQSSFYRVGCLTIEYHSKYKLILFNGMLQRKTN